MNYSLALLISDLRRTTDLKSFKVTIDLEALPAPLYRAEIKIRRRDKAHMEAWLTAFNQQPHVVGWTELAGGDYRITFPVSVLL